eukprot:1966132-Amphidinium_carterae.2
MAASKTYTKSKNANDPKPTTSDCQVTSSKGCSVCNRSPAVFLLQWMQLQVLPMTGPRYRYIQCFKAITAIPTHTYKRTNATVVFKRSIP